MTAASGDRTRALIAEAEAHGARNYAPLPVVLSRGEGCFVWDVEGRRYFDFLSAYSALNQGHNHPRIVEALVAQARTLALTSRAFHNDRMGAMLARLSAVTGFERVLPMNSGAEAVETALKAMRRWGYERRGIPDGEAKVIVAEGNFHGRTITMVSLSTDPSSYRGYGPHTPGFVKVPFGDAEAIERAIDERTAGVLIEPIQGEAGVLIPPDGYLRQVREICTRKGVALCLDEIQTGLGRTGRMFAWQHEDARPDAITLGKALSGGLYPVSAFCAEPWLMDVFTPGTHGSTYGGNPLAAAVAIAALDVIESEGLAERAATLGAHALARMRSEVVGPNVRDVRGRGLLLAVEFLAPCAHEACEELLAAGVLAKDTHEVVVRLAPPLVISREQLDEALDLILPSLARLGQRRP